MRRALGLGAVVALLLACCGPGGLQPGARFSGVPDTVMGEPLQNRGYGTISTDGRIRTWQHGELLAPPGR